MPIKAYYLTPNDTLHSDLTEDEVFKAYRSDEGLLWVDIPDVKEHEGDFLERGLGFHHLAVEDCINPQIHPPKIDPFTEYLFIIVHGINHVTDADVVGTAELEIFLGKNFVVTAHNLPLYSIAAIQEMVEDNTHT